MYNNTKQYTIRNFTKSVWFMYNCSVFRDLSDANSFMIISDINFLQNIIFHTHRLEAV